MLNFQANQDITLTISFSRDGESFVPDDGQASWALVGHDGTQLTSPASLTGITDSQVSIQVLAAHNIITDPRFFEKRTVVVNCLRNGQSFQARGIYRVAPWINMTAVEDDVRSFIGIDNGELPDADIDLFDAYLQLSNTMSVEVLDAALVAGDKSETDANAAIVAMAVLGVLPSLQFRASKTSTDSTSTITRFQLDFAALRAAAQAKLDAAIASITNADSAERLIFIIGDRTDPVTGV